MTGFRSQPGRRDATWLLIVIFLLSLPAVTTRINASDEIEFFSWLHSWTFDRDVDFVQYAITKNRLRAGLGLVLALQDAIDVAQRDRADDEETGERQAPRDRAGTRISNRAVASGN